MDEWRATWRNPMRYTPVSPGREQHEPGPELWREYTDQVTQLRDQLSAAIRLGFLGPLAGHRLQHDFYAVFEHLLSGQEGSSFGEASRSAFMLDVAQVLHEDLYSRLFQT